MAKKAQTPNKKALAIGGGIIAVLALLLVGAYGNTIKTQVDTRGVPPEVLGTPECVLARQLYTSAQNQFSRYCTPKILLSLPNVPSPLCNGALLDLVDAEAAVNLHCLPGTEDEDGAFEPPVIAPPIFELFASATPQPPVNPPAAARPGV